VPTKPVALLEAEELLAAAAQTAAVAQRSTRRSTSAKACLVLPDRRFLVGPRAEPKAVVRTAVVPPAAPALTKPVVAAAGQ
jgi:hypothetical protein